MNNIAVITLASGPRAVGYAVVLMAIGAAIAFGIVKWRQRQQVNRQLSFGAVLTPSDVHEAAEGAEAAGPTAGTEPGSASSPTPSLSGQNQVRKELWAYGRRLLDQAVRHAERGHADVISAEHVAMAARDLVAFRESTAVIDTWLAIGALTGGGLIAYLVNLATGAEPAAGLRAWLIFGIGGSGLLVFACAATIKIIKGR